jgi:predicted ATPase/class 3 adenylate cyclase
MLFADIEGSTQLLHRLGEGFAAVRARLRELVRAATAAHRGHEVDWAGDGVFLVFSSAREAVSAAAELQWALARELWPDAGAPRLRVGIHTGEPELGDEGYVGMDVVIAARICAAGHGGQILVSRATRDVTDPASLPDMSFRSLGRHQMKDVPTTEQLFQLVGPGLPDDFPPLRTLGGATLPALHHRLVGRKAKLHSIRDLLERPEVRLVTITGPGGAGKSRIALEVAGLEAVDRPVHLVGLAPISDAALVPAAIARTVGVRESPGSMLIESIGDALAGTGTLLVLDNFEHVTAGAGDMGRLLQRAPDVTLLTTSRVPLRLAGEHVVPLDPLPVDDAAELFVELAAARGVVLRDDALPSVREICRRLDGLPLAIELVAARLVVLPPAQILEALDDGLALEMEGPIDLPERQRTLRATIEWSYSLLTEPQRELHEALAVFAGGCTLADARAIASSDSRFLADLESLVALSLLRSDVADGVVRLSMLETVREHAVSRVDAGGKLDALRERHAELFLALASTAEPELTGPSHAEWLDRLERELDNIRATLDWCLSSGRVEDALRTIAALERFWRGHAHVSEARRWLSLALGLAGDLPADVRAAALRTAAQQATAQSDWEAAAALLEEARELFHECERGYQEVAALAYLGWIALRQNDPERAEALCQEALALARELDDPAATAAALMTLGDVRSTQGDHEAALAEYERAVTLRREAGDPLLIADAIYNLGMAAFQGENLVRARSAFEEALVLARELDEAPWIGAAQFMLGLLDLSTGEYGSAGHRAHEALSVYTKLEDDRSRARCLVVLAAAAAGEGSLENAARYLGAAEALRGAQDPDSFELPLLARYVPQLEEALGARRLFELKSEGTGRGARVAIREVVPSGIEE